jgi:hypothetical protein
MVIIDFWGIIFIDVLGITEIRFSSFRTILKYKDPMVIPAPIVIHKSDFLIAIFDMVLKGVASLNVVDAVDIFNDTLFHA